MTTVSYRFRERVFMGSGFAGWRPRPGMTEPAQSRVATPYSAASRCGRG